MTSGLHSAVTSLRHDKKLLDVSWPISMYFFARRLVLIIPCSILHCAWPKTWKPTPSFQDPTPHPNKNEKPSTKAQETTWIEKPKTTTQHQTPCKRPTPMEPPTPVPGGVSLPGSSCGEVYPSSAHWAEGRDGKKQLIDEGWTMFFVVHHLWVELYLLYLTEFDSCFLGYQTIYLIVLTANELDFDCCCHHSCPPRKPGHPFVYHCKTLRWPRLFHSQILQGRKSLRPWYVVSDHKDLAGFPILWCFSFINIAF